MSVVDVSITQITCCEDLQKSKLKRHILFMPSLQIPEEHVFYQMNPLPDFIQLGKENRPPPLLGRATR